MARTVRQGGQNIFVFTDAEASQLRDAVISYDLEPANFEGKSTAEYNAFDRVAAAVIPNRDK